MSTTKATLEADDLRLVFFRHDDRYAHRVEARDAATNEWRKVLESLEGTAADDWPPSPPLQQLQIERRPTGDVILLIGMAGRTHWSAAVEVAADRRGFKFDVAARVQHSPERLGSTYKREGEATAQPSLRFAPPSPTKVPTTAMWNYILSV